LPEVTPIIFNLASLNPEMSVGGGKQSDIADILSEVQASGKKDKGSLSTSEIEEKNVAIQMLAVFIDELGAAFVDYIEPTTRIILPLVGYTVNESIRNTTAGALSGLIKCAKQGYPDNSEMHLAMAANFLDALWNAIKVETETETLICQTQAIKDIIEVLGRFLNEAQINEISNQLLKIFKESEERKIENEKNAGAKEEEEEVDPMEEEQEKDVLKEENKLEDELQSSVAEVYGILFKTHKELCVGVVNTLFTGVLAQNLAVNALDNKKKIGIFILDDIVEHLGPTIIAHDVYEQVAQALLNYSTNSNGILRQAAVYGVGLMA
jgi:hypothetical protein